MGVQEDQKEQSVHAKIVQAIEILEDADTNWDTLTNAQKLAAQRLAVRVVAKLGRYVTRQFDKD